MPKPVADKLQVDVVGDTCHSNVVDCPEATDDAAEVRVTVGAEAVGAGVVDAGTVVTVTVTLSVAGVVPDAPEQVMVYVVVTEGLTVADPLSGWLTPELTHDVAFVDTQVRIDDCPAEMDVGEATAETVGEVGATALVCGATVLVCGVTVTFTYLYVVPAELEHTMPYVVFA